MFNLGVPEILVILVVALLVLGPEKLPNFMRTIGKAVGELRRASTEFQRTISIEEAESEKKTANRDSLTEDSLPLHEAPAQEASPAAAPETPAKAAPSSRKRSLPRIARAKRARSAGRDESETEDA